MDNSVGVVNNGVMASGSVWWSIRNSMKERERELVDSMGGNGWRRGIDGMEDDTCVPAAE